MVEYGAAPAASADMVTMAGDADAAAKSAPPPAHSRNSTPGNPPDTQATLRHTWRGGATRLIAAGVRALSALMYPEDICHGLGPVPQGQQWLVS